ncbi:MAG: SpoIIE family protein phosphatase [Isosphaeraceae bacterium]|nr:SpoIIE family protein phosphatase [Isosphaeraceae bacterium]
MAILKRVTGVPAGQIIELTNDLTVIGRSPECNIVLDPNGVSRKHAEIRREGNVFYLADLRSRNLTKVNNSRVEPGRDHRLQPGDRINICDVEFLYYDVPPPLNSPDPRDTATLMDIVDSDLPDDPNMHTLDASRSSAMASAVRPDVKLRAILDITRNLCSQLKIDAVAPKVLDSLKELFPQAERLFLLLQDAETKRLVRKAFKYCPNKRLPFSPSIVPDDEVPMTISRSIVSHVMDEKKAVLSQDAGNDKNLPTSASIADLKIRSVMCVPLVTSDNRAVGIIQLDTSDRKQFLQDDLDVLLAVASQAAIAIENAAMHETILEQERLARDLRLAEAVQKRFLPQTVPEIPGYEFFAYNHPALQVGGDYFDFVPLSNNRLAVALGDVAGKGVAAALMMAKFSGDTRYWISTETSPGRASTILNAVLSSAGIEEKFITLSLSVLDVEQRRLTLASAGHIPILIRRADGKLEEVGESVGGFPLGIMPDTEYAEMDVTLNPGDVAIVYSDGVPDSRNIKEELYNGRLMRRVADSGGGPVNIGRAILQDIREYSTGHSQADDITLVCFGPVTR